MATGSQERFAYSDDDLVTFEKYVSSERLAAYVIYARGDKWTAVRLYEAQHRDFRSTLWRRSMPGGDPAERDPLTHDEGNEYREVV